MITPDKFNKYDNEIKSQSLEEIISIEVLSEEKKIFKTMVGTILDNKIKDISLIEINLKGEFYKSVFLELQKIGILTVGDLIDTNELIVLKIGNNNINIIDKILLDLGIDSTKIEKNKIKNYTLHTDTKINTQIQNTLKREGIFTISELKMKIKSYIPGIGEKGKKIILDFLEENNL